LQSPETVLIAGDCVAVYDEAGNVIETHEHAGDFKEFRKSTMRTLHSSLAVTETQKRKETQ